MRATSHGRRATIQILICLPADGLILDSNSLTLQYNRNRYYDYYTGRWLTQDPFEYTDGMNLYEYGITNPITRGDPWGLFYWPSHPSPRGGAEAGFAFRFIGHFFFSRGALWSSGANVLKRQENVKKSVADELRLIAHPFCYEAVASGGFASGTFATEVRPIYANDSVFMRWTLNGAEGYKITGEYQARACAFECPCEVNLINVKHVWLDHGDLRLGSAGGHWPDWLVWFATRYGAPAPMIAHALGVFAIDFPVRIEWTASNVLRKPTVPVSFNEKRGWPWLD